MDTEITQETTNAQLPQVTTASVLSGCESTHGIPCNTTTAELFECHHGGVCCVIENLMKTICRCPDEYTGPHCERRSDEVLLDLLESRENSMVMATVTSVISLLIGLVALGAFVVLAAVVIRRKILSQKHPKECLDRHLSEIQDELDRMPAVSKLIHLTRLTKIFEASTKATAEAAILSDEINAIPQLTGTANSYLPRWSSAPAVLGRPTDEVDNTMWVDHRKLQAVFSFDEKRLRQHDAGIDDRQHTHL